MKILVSILLSFRKWYRNRVLCSLLLVLFKTYAKHNFWRFRYGNPLIRMVMFMLMFMFVLMLKNVLCYVNFEWSHIHVRSRNTLSNDSMAYHTRSVFKTLSNIFFYKNSWRLLAIQAAHLVEIFCVWYFILLKAKLWFI